MDKIAFNPIRCLEKNVPTSITNGNIYFAIDSGKIFLDTKSQRIAMGGSGVSLIYGNVETPGIITDEDGNPIQYTFAMDELSDAKNCREDDLVLNIDGCFYKIVEFDTDEAGNKIAVCDRLAVSGSGEGGGSGLARKMSIKVNQEEYHANLINGQKANAIVLVKSATDDDGEFEDEKLTVYWSIVEEGKVNPYVTGSFVVDSNVPFTFEYGSRLKYNTTSVVYFYAMGSGSGTSKTVNVSNRTIEMTLAQSSSFSTLNIYNSSNEFKLACDVKGLIKKKVVFKVDGEVIQELILEANETGTIKSDAITLTHGAHVADIELYSYDNDIQGPGPDPLSFEFAYQVAGDSTPIIWTGPYKDSYFSYDKIQIPYMVFDPDNNIAVVDFYKGKDLLESKHSEINWSETSASPAFKIFEITDATVGDKNNSGMNSYTIISGAASKNIIFECVTDPTRNMNVIDDGLLVNFNAAGRSNSESIANRQTWKYDYVSATTPENNKTYIGTFDNFNWYNNGWMLDEDKNTCLRISNGAKFSINLGPRTINTTTDGLSSATFEFEFKVKNIQNYSKVIKEITLYKSGNEDITADDSRAYEAFSAQTVFDNYDSFLTAKYDGDNEEYIEKGYNNIQAYIHPDLGYDDLVIRSTKKLKNLDNVFANYYDGTGFCLGPQDGFFTDGNDTVNVKYVEDKRVNLSIVFQQGNPGLIIFYLNGVMSSASLVTEKNGVNLTADKLVFSSDYCDIDLYKFRVYNKALDVREIDKNYAVDHRDVLLYDQADWLADPNGNLKEYQLLQDKMEYYNEQHPDDYLMPYLIIDTTNATSANGGLGKGVLPYRKSKPTKGVHIEFVNTGLEYAYGHGKLNELAEQAGYTDDDPSKEGALTAVEKYYIHHCPSFTSRWFDDCPIPDPTDGSAVSLAVQGTSSEFYPRRNFKAKFKGIIKTKETKGDGTVIEGQEDLVYMFMNRGPFADKYKENPMDAHLDWFYMDNNSVGTTKFTLKVDFMESSGSYNMGMANFVKNAYTKHPLNDYNDAGAFEKLDSTTYPAAIEFTEGTKYYVEDGVDSKGKTKYAEAETQPTAETFASGSYFTKVDTYKTFKFTKQELNDFRTSVQGFRVLCFHKNGDNVTFIGMYNMLLDKGSDEVYGFKLDKKILGKFLKHKAIRKKVECWEFSDNSRTFCSYNDPLGRETFSFAQATDGSADKTAAQVLNKPEAGGQGGAPAVADSFEYRYNTDGDLLDYLYAPETGGMVLYNAKREDDDGNTYEVQVVNKETDPKTEDYETEYPEKDYGDLTIQSNRNKAFFDIYANWEKACAWLYTTRTTNQPSQIAFKETNVTASTYEANKYYIKTSEPQYYAADKYDSTAAYYERIETVDEDTGITSVTYEYAENVTEDQFGGKTYYLQDTSGYKLCSDVTFSAKQVYYVKDESYKQDQYKLDPAVTIGNTTYEYDTKEYRLAKFKKELKDHFDLEYCLVYFLITEVFMLYDSRGKNCMMASWGPLKDKGEYIWYPIFYDMDTQLGINNTGIPSFEYYVNATEEGCFSTNDSVLWMNLYQAFLPEIRSKYYAMRGVGNGIINVNTGAKTTPLKGVDASSIEESVDDLDSTVAHIEAWYSTDPDEIGSLAMTGVRPLIARNLDEYYKYISIMNTKIGYQTRDGDITTDQGTYFYALQGDRSLSRQQFLHDRLNFIDSWLNNGEYARGGSAIFGRIGANDARNTNGQKVYSDYWLNAVDPDKIGQPVPDHSDMTYNSYFDENGEKTEFLDADVSVKLVPYQYSYVAIGGDNGVTGSGQYSGKPVQLELPTSVVDGRLNSASYGEQLFYIYGTKSLQDIGDCSTLYWSEFYATKSPRLQRILLGSNYPGFFNHGMNYPNLDAGATSTYGKPLLKEVNLDHVHIQGDTQTFDLSTSEKLQHFEAIDSTITGVTFAPGVALDTLYLPASVNSLNLVEARQLKGVVEVEPLPTTPEQYHAWVAPKGLYVAGLTDKIGKVVDSDVSQISTFSLTGGALGYNSYQLLDTLYRIKLTSASSSNRLTNLAISLTNVEWSPYAQLGEGDIYDTNNKSLFVIDNKHYGFDTYAWVDQDQWNKDIANGRVFKKVTDDPGYITDYSLLKNLAEKSQFSNTNATGNTDVPVITGIVYIDNTTPVEESYVREVLRKWYPNLTFFFANVTKAYSANFYSINDDGVEVLIDSQKIKQSDYAADNTVFFASPYEKYKDRVEKNHYDFAGWSTEPNNIDYVVTADKWANERLVVNKFDYDYYVISTIHEQNIKIVDGDGNVVTTLKVPYGSPIPDPQVALSKDSSDLDLYECYKFTDMYFKDGSTTAVKITSQISLDDHIFVGQFEKASVYDSILPDKYFNITAGGYISLKPEYKSTLKGKITLPTTVDGIQVMGILPSPQGADNGAFSNLTGGVTHIFWDKANRAITSISDYAFTALNRDTSKLIYFEMPETVTSIGARAFAYNDKLFQGLSQDHVDEFFKNITFYGSYCFYGCAVPNPTSDKFLGNKILKINGNTTEIGQRAFSSLPIKEIEIGSPTAKVQSFAYYGQDDGGRNPIFNSAVTSGYAINKLTIYSENSLSEAEKNNLLDRLFGSGNSVPLQIDFL